MLRCVASSLCAKSVCSDGSSKSERVADETSRRGSEKEAGHIHANYSDFRGLLVCMIDSNQNVLYWLIFYIYLFIDKLWFKIINMVLTHKKYIKTVTFFLRNGITLGYSTESSSNILWKHFEVKDCSKQVFFSCHSWLFLQSHFQLQLCPGADCPMVIKVQEPRARRVQCSRCNEVFW